MEDRLRTEMVGAESKAWESLAGYKFVMFGYHAAIWVALNKLQSKPFPNPFRPVIEVARQNVDSNTVKNQDAKTFF